MTFRKGQQGAGSSPWMQTEVFPVGMCQPGRVSMWERCLRRRSCSHRVPQACLAADQLLLGRASPPWGTALASGVGTRPSASCGQPKSAQLGAAGPGKQGPAVWAARGSGVSPRARKSEGFFWDLWALRQPLLRAALPAAAASLRAFELCSSSPGGTCWDGWEVTANRKGWTGEINPGRLYWNRFLKKIKTFQACFPFTRSLPGSSGSSPK